MSIMGLAWVTDAEAWEEFYTALEVAGKAACQPVETQVTVLQGALLADVGWFPTSHTLQQALQLAGKGSAAAGGDGAATAAGSDPTPAAAAAAAAGSPGDVLHGWVVSAPGQAAGTSSYVLGQHADRYFASRAAALAAAGGDASLVEPVALPVHAGIQALTPFPCEAYAWFASNEVSVSVVTSVPPLCTQARWDEDWQSP
jgi:hypothetical protein